VAIEYQGRQHFEPISKFGGKIEYEKIKERDIVKYNLCQKNGIKLFYFSNEKKTLFNEYIDKVFSDKEELIKEILEYGKNNRL
jgi:hypothetical protein